MLQIKIHPEHTKFFAFASPNGQFTKFPFGFCEALDQVTYGCKCVSFSCHFVL